ncbi:MAG TPA: iron-containing redox enzyme family protein [Thermoleophilaceae bacterium]|nr:iron-containing redox enzyme family protein [Thermoleophilaceae bacterium]
MEFFAELDAVRERWNVLNHPFYTRWSEGTLTRDELAYYSGQYRHAVVALAVATRAAADAEPALEPHALEEAAHVDLWDGFVSAVGGDSDAAPAPETASCAQAWAKDGSLLETLVGIYAIEAAQPAISATKASGLRERYGIDSSSATAYFDLHEHLDLEHADAGRAFIAERLDGAEQPKLVARAEDVLRANWELLDGIERMAR